MPHTGSLTVAIASSFRRRDGVSDQEPRDDSAATDELAATVSAYFRQQEGRAHACKAEAYRREDRFYYFAYAENYANTSIELDEQGQLRRRPGRPTFEIVWVYSPAVRALDTSYRGPKRTREELEQIFARVVLGTDLPALQKDGRVYEMNRFKRPGVRFVYDAASGIEDVRTKQLRCAILGGGKDRIVIESDPVRERDAVYRLLDRLTATGQRGGDGTNLDRIPLTLFNVTKVGLEARFARGTGRGHRTKSFSLTYPNRCSLGHDGRDAVLRKMLIDSGIEPVRTEPQAAAL